ncbi:hypothetical protein PS662_01604 [Pseudomonas fluorescens]|uniref:Anti-sigma factor n=1 Tax=Pseudomonas fluorescens TaxID=294 RepID=A0A5E6RDK6_PSEFL|nr:anti-sigma factor [Pseudomonas fluorescens]VVM67034.1 hypothetical protein PS662_01604 [Pseudomonas fluorescens]
MITLPPSECDLHSYVDGHLSETDRQALEIYLASNSVLYAQVQAWQLDAQRLRALMRDELHLAPNPTLDPAFIRKRLLPNRARQYATAAVVLMAVSVGGLCGWQMRGMSMSGTPPMADAVQAYRMFALKDDVASDWKPSESSDVQDWIDANFASANRLPDLLAAGFKPVKGRLVSTEQGAAATVIYKDASGRTVSFFIRPPVSRRHPLPHGTRRDGELQTDYWSGNGYNYAVVGLADDRATQAALRSLSPPI